MAAAAQGRLVAVVDQRDGHDRAGPDPDIVIDKGIPIPAPQYRRRYPFAEMQVGDSFFTPVARRSIGNSLSHQQRKHGRRFIARPVVEGGVKGTRVWRVE